MTAWADVKDRIIEVSGTEGASKKKSAAPILLLVGAGPGVGKTFHSAISVQTPGAQSFYRFSVGGIVTKPKLKGIRTNLYWRTCPQIRAALKDTKVPTGH